MVLETYTGNDLMKNITYLKRKYVSKVLKLFNL